MFAPFILRSRRRGITPSDILADLALWFRGDNGLKTGGARQFTSANTEYFSIADDAVFDLGTGDFLLNVFVYLDTSGVQHTISSKYEDENNYWKLEVTSGDKLHFIAVASGSTVVEVTGTTSLSTGQYYGVALAVDRNATANTKFYVDGVAEVSGTPTVGATSLDNSGRFYLGVDVI